MMTELFEKVAADDLDGLKAAFAANPAAAGQRNSAGASLLMWTVYLGKPEATKLVRAALPAIDPYEAIILGDIERVMEALGTGWDGNVRSPDGFTPLGLAAFFNQPEIFGLLMVVTRNVNDRAENPQQVAALHAASATRNNEMVEQLLKAGADPNLPQSDGFVPLHSAAQHGDEAMVDLLIAHGADRKYQNARGETPGDIAFAAGHTDLANRLDA
jgi:ankyrin repeat protein